MLKPKGRHNNKYIDIYHHYYMNIKKNNNWLGEIKLNEKTCPINMTPDSNGLIISANL